MVGPAYATIVADVYTNSPAARAGLKAFDEITEFNGKKLHFFGQVSEYVQAHPDQPVQFTVVRGNLTNSITLQPEKPVSPPDQSAMLGILWEYGGPMKLAHPGVWQQIYDSVDALVSTLGALFSSKSDISAQHLSGAVKILNIYYILFESPEGWRLALWFSVLLNVNLAILNLLPIPVLDGGHIVLALVEAARRKPVNIRVLSWLQNGCALLLIGYMLYITFYDVQDLGWGGDKSKESAVPVFAPAPDKPPELRPVPSP